ncbi:hypothetical protein E6O75_ATG05419 [Venturia nashicola]|uniref:Uncharacterized protein n=1 Tax=Venturia nashicola TaxID=86259 RepID=A0A4Z1NZE3_9PEZI|nr:hypothetical protein E6O75_ATG05419 [Venturia nashicola]
MEDDNLNTENEEMKLDSDELLRQTLQSYPHLHQEMEKKHEERRPQPSKPTELPKQIKVADIIPRRVNGTVAVGRWAADEIFDIGKERVAAGDGKDATGAVSRQRVDSTAGDGSEPSEKGGVAS